MNTTCMETNGTILQKTKTTERVFFLDILRVIACFCVVMIHTSAEFVVKDFGTFNFWVGNVFDSLARIGVPLFVMISGTIFLDENYNFTNIKLFHHIKKIVVFFVFWSLCYSLFFNLFIPLIKHNNISIKSIIAGTVLGHYHLWFCFMIVGLYLIIPLLRLWVNKENIKQVRYFIILSFIFSMFLPSIIEYLSFLFPAFDSLNSIINNINIRYVGGFTVYFVLGWYLNNYEIEHKKIFVSLGLSGIAISIIGTALLSILTNEPHQAYDNLSVHIAFQAIMVYVLIKNKFTCNDKNNYPLKKIVSFISNNSFGVYAIHIVILDSTRILLTKIGIYSSIIFIPIAFIITTSLSILISFVIKKIPIIKNVV